MHHLLKWKQPLHKQILEHLPCLFRILVEAFGLGAEKITLKLEVEAQLWNSNTYEAAAGALLWVQGQPTESDFIKKICWGDSSADKVLVMQALGTEFRLQNTQKSCIVGCTCRPSTGEAETVSLGYLTNSRPVRDPVFKNKVRVGDLAQW